MKKNPYPTVAEQLERAKDGWFYEFSIKEWIHISQVETEEMTNQFLDEKVYCKKIIRFRNWLNNDSPKLFWTCVVPLLVAICFAFSGIHNLIVIAAFLSYGLGAFLLGVILFRIFDREPYGPFGMCDGTEVILSLADELKNGFIYDAKGNKHAFQNTGIDK